MWWVYILHNTQTKSYYVGSTHKLEERVRQHNVKRKRKWSGRQNGMWQLVYKEPFADKKRAFQRERFIKKRKSRLYIEKLLENKETKNGVVD